MSNWPYTENDYFGLETAENSSPEHVDMFLTKFYRVDEFSIRIIIK